MTTTPEVTITSHPFQVGIVVYPSLEEATAAVERASAIYPDALILIKHRATGLTVLPLEEEYDWQDEGPTCSICDALGHGYPGAGPCPLEVTDYSGEPAWAM